MAPLAKDFTAIKIRWILVASRTEAIVYSLDSRHKNFRKVVTYEHTDGRRQDKTFNSDRPGRVKDSFGGAKHSYSKEISPAKQRMIKFAQVLCDIIRRGRLDKRFDEWILVCSPALLGTIRDLLKSTDAKSLMATFPKDLMRLTAPQRERAIMNLLEEI